MTPAEYECPDCGDPAVLLSPDADGAMLASCQGCGRAHGSWAEVQSVQAADAASSAAKRGPLPGWLLKGASR